MAMSQRAKDDYHARKERGDCVREGCGNTAGDATVVCDQHLKLQRRYSKTSRGKAKVKIKQRRAAKLWRKKRVARGECIHCGKPAVTETLCARHQAENVAYYHARSTKPKSTQRCSLCREQGHRAPTCPNPVLDVVVPQIEEMAAARREAA
jgi:hypothetical protein